ncbi:1,4-alpha-glucan branching protein [Kitasatospora sp. NPDC049285]|uniref:maltokinase N-terminal cap-like domain-containing protein n=1 Tax=Kitasatospora sp. NPDC049285 TaxID=3157096 RepID=UPI003443A475
MATIHRTTMEPTKLELLVDWLPRQEWYRTDGAGELERAGGFRLDDPAGEVGIELMVVTDGRAAYLVPMSYRGAPLDGAPAQALIGTSEHGVLGTRWIYDGEHDPVVREQLAALLGGKAEPQMQSESDRPDPTVAVGAVPASVAGVALRRVLSPGAGEPAAGEVVAGYTAPDGSAVRAVFAAAVTG